MCLDVKVNPNMPRKQSKAGPEGNGYVPHRNEFGSGEPTMADLYRMLKEMFNGRNKNFDRTTSYFDRQEKGKTSLLGR